MFVTKMIEDTNAIVFKRAFVGGFGTMLGHGGREVSFTLFCDTLEKAGLQHKRLSSIWDLKDDNLLLFHPDLRAFSSFEKISCLAFNAGACKGKGAKEIQWIGSFSVQVQILAHKNNWIKLQKLLPDRDTLENGKPIVEKFDSKPIEEGKCSDEVSTLP